MTVVAALGVIAAVPQGASAEQATTCEFQRGTTTCTAVAQTTETAERTVFSGCLAGPPPFVAGVRRDTFVDTFVVNTTTITQFRGRAGPLYNLSTTTVRELQSSQLVSSTCTRVSP